MPDTVENGCGHGCSGCERCSGCGKSSADPKPAEPLTLPPNSMSRIKKVIGVLSGKGGVGKSLLASLSAIQLARRGYKTAVLDADITGPSIPHIFGIHEKAQAASYGILPAVSSSGIDIISINLFLDDETEPVLWTGSVMINTLRQFWTDVIWGDIDYMFVDMPSGTGEVLSSLLCELPLDGVILVTSPQELAYMISAKTLNMLRLYKVPVLGTVENMPYLSCDTPAESMTDKAAYKLGPRVVARLPYRPEIAQAADRGQIEDIEFKEVSRLIDFLETI